MRESWVRAATLCRLALERDHHQRESPVAELRFRAAAAAASAAQGLGRDPEAQDPAVRAAWRAQAIRWLARDLELVRRFREIGGMSKAELGELLGRWRDDPAFAGLRGEPVWSEFEALAARD